jgi:hypothetical protein
MIPWLTFYPKSNVFYKQERNFLDSRPPLPLSVSSHPSTIPKKLVFYKIEKDIEKFKTRISSAREKRVQRSRELR